MDASAELPVDASHAELCMATYCARQIAGCVVLYALGVHHSSGRVVFLRRDPGEDFPPHFSLWHASSGAPEIHAVTPFAASASFQTMKEVRSVVVTDAAGPHVIAVDEESDATGLRCSGRL